jgi:predicted RNase H-like HicB family nuclease
VKYPKKYVYPAVFTYVDGEEIAVSFPDLPGCVTCGETDMSALEMARDALGGHLLCLEIDNDPIPAPTSLANLSKEENEQLVLIDVYMPSVRFLHENRAVNRTVTLPAWLNAASLERGVNFSQVLQSALMEQLGIDKQSHNL